MTFFESVLQDARFGVRQLRRSRGFLAAAVLTLALGIGANTSMFSVVYAVVLKPLPFEQGERLVGVWSSAPGVGWKRVVLAPAQYFTYREEGRAFEDVAIWTQGSVTVTGLGEPERVPVLSVTDGFLSILRVEPAHGRVFTGEDDLPGAPPRVIVTHAYWQQRLGGSRRLEDRPIAIDGKLHEVIGVLPRAFRFLETTPALLLPFRFNRAAITIQDFSYKGLARLKPGVTVEQANADVARMIPLVPEKFPPSPAIGKTWFRDAKLGPDVRLLSRDAASDLGEVLWVLMAMIGLVLLIACANVANLFLVRAEGRQQELAVRAALGASRPSLARALLSESVMLGLAGGVVGVALAYAATRAVRFTAPDALPRVDDIALDPVVLLVALGLSLVAGLLFGLVPVLKFATPRLAALKDGGRAASDGRDRHRTRSVLVVSEIALALVLLVAAGLMLRTFQALRQVDPGFTRGSEVLTLVLSLPNTTAPDAESVGRRHQEIIQRIEQVPGVESVGLTSSIPLAAAGMSNPMLVEDFPQASGQPLMSRRMKWISPRYFETMGARIVAGRSLAWADVSSYAPVVVINERLSREYWKTPAEALGKRVRESAGSPWREIIGVVSNAREDGLAQDVVPIVYYPYIVRNFWTAPMQARRTLIYVIRSPRAGTATFTREVRRAIWAIDANLPLADIQTMEEVAARSMAQTSFAMVMLAIAAAVSLLLGVVGIYGVISYITAQRTREVGIRVALGAQPADVCRLFVRHGLVLAAAGIATGVGASLWLSRLMASMLFGVAPSDPVTYGAVSLGLAAVAMLAGYLPARRAARLHPLSALRSE
ncbi:MAG TPA: ABC transporter permease [Vicinamibacterales bacterium]|nr:ABC transporter permease [Vicinamibacterales bacterium]